MTEAGLWMHMNMGADRILFVEMRWQEVGQTRWPGNKQRAEQLLGMSAASLHLEGRTWGGVAP